MATSTRQKKVRESSPDKEAGEESSKKMPKGGGPESSKAGTRGGGPESSKAGTRGGGPELSKGAKREEPKTTGPKKKP